MDEEKELERLDLVYNIHKERVDMAIQNTDKAIARNMLWLDKVHQEINKLTTERIFLFNQETALRELNEADSLSTKTKEYDKFMDLFIKDQPKCSIKELQSLVGYNIVKHWLDNLINDFGEEEEQKDFDTIMQIIDKYYKRLMS